MQRHIVLSATALLLATTLTACKRPAAFEPNWEAPPTYGTQNLTNNFQPDPVVVPVLAGGADEVTRRGCSGFIHGAAPDVDLNYVAGNGLPLNIYVTSSADTTLLVFTPELEWICNDDTHGTNPVITLASPPSGNYNIWVGNYDGTETPKANLHISEISPQW